MNFYNVRALLLQRVGPPSEDGFEEWYRHPNWGPCSMCGSESGGPAVVAEVALCSVFALSAGLLGVPVLCLSDDIFDVELVSTRGTESIIAAVSATA